MTELGSLDGGNPQNWSLDSVAAALRVAMDDLETFERAGADLLWGAGRGS